MGHYTKFHLQCELWCPPDEVVQVLAYLVSEPRSMDSPVIKELLIRYGGETGRAFAEEERWWQVAQGGSTYGQRHPQSYCVSDIYTYKNTDGQKWCYQLFIHSEVKSGKQAIEKFLEWLRPWLSISGNDPEFIGYTIDDTGRDQAPTLLYLVRVPEWTKDEVTSETDVKYELLRVHPEMQVRDAVDNLRAKRSEDQRYKDTPSLRGEDLTGWNSARNGFVS